MIGKRFIHPSFLKAYIRAYICLILTLICLLYAQNSHANQDLQFGLAMHGSPKHDRESAHLDYVNPNAPKGGEITHAAIGSFDSLNPYAIKGTPAKGLHLIYDRLMGRAWDEPFSLYPLIAKGYRLAQDRSWITFYLNPKARFSDGSPITPEDVIFSFKTLKSHGRPNMRRVYELVDKISQPEVNAVRFDLKQGYNRETVMILAIMPVLSKSFWEDKDFNATLLTKPVSSGPYQIERIDPGKTITYKRYPEYWAKNLLINRGLYNFETIRFDYFRDKNIAYESVMAGEISFWREDDAGRWTRLQNKPVHSLETQGFEHYRPERVNALIFNTRRPPFDNVKVRQALTSVFDAKWVNKNLYYNKYYRIQSYYPNSELASQGLPDKKQLEILEKWREEIPASVFGPAYKPPQNTNRRELRSNIQLATQWLEQEGWIIKDGIRVNKATEEPFEFEIILNNLRQKKIALALKRNLKKLGINVTLRVLDSAAFFGRLNKYDYDMVMHYWQSTLSPGTEQILFWGCLAAKQEARWNYAGICNPAIDHISARIAMSETRDELASLTHALDRILTHSHYMIPLFYRGEDWVVYDKALKYPDYTPVYGLVQESWWQNSKN